MSTETIKIDVDENWQEFFTTIDGSITFSTPGPSEVYVLERTAQPSPEERGNVYMPTRGGGGILRVGSFWVRSKDGTVAFYFEEA